MAILFALCKAGKVKVFKHETKMVFIRKVGAQKARHLRISKKRRAMQIKPVLVPVRLNLSSVIFRARPRDGKIGFDSKKFQEYSIGIYGNFRTVFQTRSPSLVRFRIYELENNRFWFLV